VGFTASWAGERQGKCSARQRGSRTFPRLFRHGRTTAGPPGSAAFSELVVTTRGPAFWTCRAPAFRRALPRKALRFPPWVNPHRSGSGSRSRSRHRAPTAMRKPAGRPGLRAARATRKGCRWPDCSRGRSALLHLGLKSKRQARPVAGTKRSIERPPSMTMIEASHPRTNAVAMPPIKGPCEFSTLRTTKSCVR